MKITNITIEELKQMSDTGIIDHCFLFPYKNQWISKDAYKYALERVS